MSQQTSDCQWMDAYMQLWTAVRQAPPSVAIRGLTALAARIECRDVPMSPDCKTCQNRETCPRFGGHSNRRWWAIGQPYHIIE